MTVPSGYVEGPILPNLYVHPWSEIDAAGDEQFFVIVLGVCVPMNDQSDRSVANALLATLRRGGSTFFNALDEYVGRHAILFGSTDNINVVNDATAMRSVFYAAEGGAIASHALLVEHALGGHMGRDALPFRYGYPGNRTPYKRTRILTANTYYQFSENTVHRFWPVLAPVKRGTEDVAMFALESAAAALRNATQGRTVKVSLTAGLDSRTVLAVALHSGIKFESYTYGVAKDTELDRTLASDMADAFGIRHWSVSSVGRSDDLNQKIAEAHYSSHHVSSIGGLIDLFHDHKSVAVSANLLEIGRGNFVSARKAGVDSPLSKTPMADLHCLAMGGFAKRLVREFGSERFFTSEQESFSWFIEETGYSSVTGMLHPFDQFYWEHRMSAWHGPAMSERDFYAEAFIPFNSRRIFETMLGVSREERDRADVFYRMIEIVDPRLLDFPVNPKQWPPPTA